MQELRFVLIVVGALAIAALLFHGLWTSKKEGKSKFSDKPLGKLAVEGDEIFDRSNERAFAPEDDFEIIRKDTKPSTFRDEELNDDPLMGDPLVSDYPVQEEPETPVAKKVEEPLDDIPSISALDRIEIDLEPVSSPTMVQAEIKPEPVEQDVKPDAEPELVASEPQVEVEPEPEVIIINVHCAGEEPFVGTKLFDSMQQHDLVYGEMNIFHRHTDLSGTGKVLFSVANMMHPGTLEHNDPAEFTTKGISFFMMLPCYGDEEQNFKLMLQTAQQIADDLGGRVLDDARNLLTPNRIDGYKTQVKEYKARKAS
ncbi:cell division protein ZipA [Vibrio taketomensis]|uniref:cell division protein ZipA n=1 Tax=Vibrio taketomensis TaxID=2572923 RepID=UPI00138A0620|nr:cell division protein ZipA [Vibrio taketomensis]